MSEAKGAEEMNKLQAARQAAGLTQQQLADQTGISLSSIQKYERDAKDINKAQATTLKKLTDALGCQIQDIVTDPKLLEWAETTPPWFQAMYWANVEAEAEYVRERVTNRMKKLQDKRNGIKREEPKRVEPVKAAGETVKRSIPIDFDIAFIPPEEFSNELGSMCNLCPFCGTDWETGSYCMFPENVNDKCHLGKYFE